MSLSVSRPRPRSRLKMPSKRSASASNTLHRRYREERGGELVGVERDRGRSGASPDADQLHGDAQLGLDRQDDAALGRAVELGEHDAGHVDGLGELRACARPFCPVVASITSSTSLSALGALDDPAELLELAPSG